MKSDNILVIGGTGKTGSRVVSKLENQRYPVRVGSRNGTPAFDWENPETFDPVLKSMDRVYITYHPDLAVPGAKEAIEKLTEAALRQGVEKVVLLSGKGEQEAEACEEIVAHSGLNYTLVRASWFNQNFSESIFLESILAGQVALPMPEAEVPFVDADDIADVVVKVLLDDSYNGKTITVTGPRKLTFRAVIEEIAIVTGRTISFTAITLEAYIEGMKLAGVPQDYIWLLGYLFKEVLGNAENQTVSDDFEKVMGRPATDFSEFVTKTEKSGVWKQTITQSV
ncbi:MAG: NmrA family NAD(P)-binding protein [Bacteroidota bacterium]